MLKLKDFINKHKKHYYNWLNGLKGLLGFLRSHMQKPSCFAATLQYSREHHKDEEPETAQRQEKKNKIFPIFWAQSGITEVDRAPEWSQMDAAASPSWSHSLIPAVYIYICIYIPLPSLLSCAPPGECPKLQNQLKNFREKRKNENIQFWTQLTS